MYGYDEQGNRISDTNALGESRRYRYDTRGNLVADLSPLWIAGSSSNGHLSTLSEYDAYGRKTREENGVKTDGSTFDYQSWSYDHFGRQTAARDLAGSTSSTYYDQFGRVARQTRSAVTQTATNPDVSTHNSDLRYVYADNGQLQQQQESSGGSQVPHTKADKPSGAEYPY